MNRFALGAIALLVVLATVPVTAGAQAPDHSTYDRLLNEYVEGGYFDYEAFVRDEDNLRNLKQYLDAMSTVDPRELSADQELAYWMNLYNASTIELVLRNYPLESIRDLDGWFGTIFSKEFIEVGDRTMSLDNVEHDTIRERFDEPRIHFALVCAARSCPPLRDEAYVGERLDEQLEEQTETFLESDKNRFTVRNGTLRAELSMILSWYAEDFGGEDGVMEFIGKYLPDRKRKLIQEGSYSVDYISYDWDLNQAPGPYSQ